MVSYANVEFHGSWRTLCMQNALSENLVCDQRQHVSFFFLYVWDVKIKCTAELAASEHFPEYMSHTVNNH